MENKSITVILQSDKCKKGEIWISKYLANRIDMNQVKTIKLMRYPVIVIKIPWYKKLWNFITRKKNTDSVKFTPLELTIIGVTDGYNHCYINAYDLMQLGADMDGDTAYVII